MCSRWNQLLGTLHYFSIACVPVAYCCTVCDRDNHRVHVYNIDKLNEASQFPGAIEKLCPTIFGSKGTGKSQFNRPRGVAVDNFSGEIYIADQLNHRIQVRRGISDVRRGQVYAINFRLRFLFMMHRWDWRIPAYSWIQGQRRRWPLPPVQRCSHA